MMTELNPRCDICALAPIPPGETRVINLANAEYMSLCAEHAKQWQAARALSVTGGN